MPFIHSLWPTLVLLSNLAIWNLVPQFLESLDFGTFMHNGRGASKLIIDSLPILHPLLYSFYEPIMLLPHDPLLAVLLHVVGLHLQVVVVG